MSSRPLQRTIALSAIAALGLGLVALTAGSASATPSDINTPGWTWINVDDGIGVTDMESSLGANYHGSGITMAGWTDDSFDTFANDLTVGDGATTQSVTLAPVSDSRVDNGLSTIVSSGSADFGGGVVVDVTATLEIQGSYARWTIDVTGVGTGDPSLVSVSLTGNLGSDSETVYTPVGTHGLESDDGTDVSDPILGWDLASTGGTTSYTVANGDDNPVFTATGASQFVLTFAAQDYEQCARAAAVTAMTALVPSLASSFGGNLGELTTPDCIVLPSPAAITPDSAVNATIPLNPSPGGFDYIADWTGTDDLGVFATGLPAGLSLAMVDNGSGPLNKLVLSGSTTQTGTFPVSVLIYETDGPGQGIYPVLTTLSLTVPPTLAATGTNPVPGLVLAGGLVGAGIIAMTLVRRRKNAKHSA